MRSLLLLAVVVLSGGCTAQQRAMLQAATEDAPAPATVPDDGLHPGTEGGRFMFGDADPNDCHSSYAPVSMPCRLVLLVCNESTREDGIRVPMMLPAQYRCGPNSPTLAQACAEQPEYAAWYNCAVLDR